MSSFNILCFVLVCPSVCFFVVSSSNKTFNGSNGKFSSERRSDGLILHNLTTEYNIEVPSGRRAILSFTKFNVLGVMPNCTGDSLEVFVGCQMRRSVGKYCSCGLVTYLPFDFYSIDECITLTYKVDARYPSHDLRGFDVEYSSAPRNQSVKNVCSSIGNTSSVKNIFTPMWPNNYPDKTNCTWTVETPVNHTTIIQFMDFAIEKSVFCDPKDERDDKVMIKASKTEVPFNASDIEVIKRRICSQLTDEDNRKIFQVIVPQDYRRVYIDFINDQDNNTAPGIAAGFISYMSGPSERQIIESCLYRFIAPPSHASPSHAPPSHAPPSHAPSSHAEMLLSTNLLFLLAFPLLFSI